MSKLTNDEKNKIIKEVTDAVTRGEFFEPEIIAHQWFSNKTSEDQDEMIKDFMSYFLQKRTSFFITGESVLKSALGLRKMYNAPDYLLTAGQSILTQDVDNFKKALGIIPKAINAPAPMHIPGFKNFKGSKSLKFWGVDPEAMNENEMSSDKNKNNPSPRSQ